MTPAASSSTTPSPAYPAPASHQQMRTRPAARLGRHTAPAQHRLETPGTRYRDSPRGKLPETPQRRPLTLPPARRSRPDAAAVRRRRGRYQQALDITTELGDRHSAADHLPPARHDRPGTAAVRRGRGQLPAGPDLYLELSDRRSAAITHRQLGSVAEEQRRFAEAEAATGSSGHLPGLRRPARRRQRVPHSGSSPRSSGGTPTPRPATGRPWTSSWSSATGTAPPAATIGSAQSPRCRGGSPPLMPLPAGPGHLAGVWRPAQRGRQLPSARDSRSGSAAVRRR